MNLDVENRIYLAAIALVSADAGVRGIVGSRTFKSGDQTHKAQYPIATIGIPSCYCFDNKTGWYKATVVFEANTLISDDKDMAVRERLLGFLRGIIQSGTVEKDLNNTAPARSAATALTVLDAALADSYAEEDGNVRTAGLSVEMLVRPSTGKNQG